MSPSVVTMLLVLGSGKSECQSILGQLKKKSAKTQNDMKIFHSEAEDLILEVGKAKQAAIRQQKQLTNYSSLEIKDAYRADATAADCEQFR
jgi:hypothetical protein